MAALTAPASEPGGDRPRRGERDHHGGEPATRAYWDPQNWRKVVTSSLSDIIEAFAGLNVMVIGEAMLDVYLEGTTRRLCPEAPVPVVDLAFRRDLPGGAANTALNVAMLGARVSLMSVVGDDSEGATLARLLGDQEIDDTSLFAERGRRTLAKHRLLAGNHLLVRFDHGDTAPMSSESEG